MKSIKTGAAAFALLALSQPQLAMAQDCVAEADVADTAVYAMPALLSAVEAKCAGSLKADGYLAANGAALKARFSARATDTWPGAKRLIGKILAKQSGGGGEPFSIMLSAMPADAFSPFLSTIVTQKLGERMKVKDCGMVERFLEVIDPLPPENVGSMIGLFLSLGDSEKLKICPAAVN